MALDTCRAVHVVKVLNKDWFKASNMFKRTICHRSALTLFKCHKVSDKKLRHS